MCVPFKRSARPDPMLVLDQRSKNTGEGSLGWVADRNLSLLFPLDLSCPLLCHVDDHTDPPRVLPNLPCAPVVYVHRTDSTGAYGDEERRRARTAVGLTTKHLCFFVISTAIILVFFLLVHIHSPGGEFFQKKLSVSIHPCVCAPFCVMIVIPILSPSGLPFDRA